VEKDGRRHTVLLADELVELNGYDATAVRQLSAYDDGKVVFQILAFHTDVDGAALVERLRGR